MSTRSVNTSLSSIGFEPSAPSSINVVSDVGNALANLNHANGEAMSRLAAVPVSTGMPAMAFQGAPIPSSSQTAGLNAIALAGLAGLVVGGIGGAAIGAACTGGSAESTSKPKDSPSAADKKPHQYVTKESLERSPLSPEFKEQSLTKEGVEALKAGDMATLSKILKEKNPALYERWVKEGQIPPTP